MKSPDIHVCVIENDLLRPKLSLESSPSRSDFRKKKKGRSE